MKILLVAINAKYIHSNPAVYSLYSYAKSYQDNIEIVQYNINQQSSDILADIFYKAPDVIAISCYIWNMEMVRRLVVDINDVLPDTKIWLGGPEVSFDAPKLLEEYPELTGVMIGEGESTFTELVEYYVNYNANRNNKNNGLESIPGLWIRNKEAELCKQKPCIYTGERQITDLDSIPFIYTKERLEQFKNQIIYYESSRGCPFRCSYCLSAIDKTVRLRSLTLVLPELQFFLDNNVPQVKFIDRTFNCNKEHAMTIWKYLLEHDNGITNFHFEVAADLLTDDEIDLIGQMRPGLIQLEIGVQSTNLQTINEINRRMDLEKVADNVARVRAFGNTHQHLDLIVGLPYEDKASFIKSFNDVHNMQPNQLQLGFLKVLKGSVMESKVKEYDLKYHKAPQYEVFSTKWISYKEVLELKRVEEMVELFYNSAQFNTTLKVLMPQFESPYAFYEAIALYYEEKGYYVQTPARSYRYNVVYEFGKKYVDEQLLAQALTYDLYLRENCKSRVDFAKDLTPYKTQIRALSGEKERTRQAHIDVFDYCLWDESFGTRLTTPIFIRFDYTNRSPLSGDAVVSIICR